MNLGRILAAPLLLAMFLMPGLLSAQSSIETDHAAEAATLPTCGSDWARGLDEATINENTRLHNPELYSRMMADAAKGGSDRALLSSASATTSDFWVIDRTTGGRARRTAEGRYFGSNIIIWVDAEENTLISDETIEALVHGMEVSANPGVNTISPDNGIRANDIAMFGAPPFDNWAQEEDFIHLYLLDIDEGNLTGGSISGYFYPVDQISSAAGSNNRNLLYIDCERLRTTNVSARAINSVLGTIAHEFQHLINYGRYPQPIASSHYATHWMLNEGLSEVASLRNGFKDREATATMSSPNMFAYFDAPYASTSGETILPGYERAMLLTHYLSERFGDEFLYELVSSTGRNLEPIAKALSATGNPRTAEQVFAEFWVANYLQSADNFQGDEEFRYRYSVGGRNASTTFVSFPDGEVTESMSVKGYAAVLPRYANGDSSATRGMTVRFLPNGGASYGVHAVVFYKNGSIVVSPVPVNEPAQFKGFSDIVFIVASLSSGEQSVRWTTENTALENSTTGVAEGAGTEAGLMISATTPNPVRNNARVDFTTGQSGQVTLELFDARGSRVRTLVEREILAQGAHTVQFDASTMEPGVYTLRLEQENGAFAMRRIVVVR